MFTIRRGCSYSGVKIVVDRDLRNYARVVLTIVDASGHKFDLDNTKLSITENAVSFNLSELDTLSMSPGSVLLQLRAKNNTYDALASEIMESWAADILNEEALDIE